MIIMNYCSSITTYIGINIGITSTIGIAIITINIRYIVYYEFIVVVLSSYKVRSDR